MESPKQGMESPKQGTSLIQAAPDEFARMAEDYELPKAVKAKLAADIQQAQSITIVITLLAGALITLTSILGGIDSANEGSGPWKAFRVLLWGAIVFDVGEAFLCILAIKMCSELPLLAMERHVMQRDGPALSQGRVDAPRRGPQPPGRFRHRYLMLESVGMHPLYWLVDHLVIWVLASASVLSFVTLFYWVLQTMTRLPAMLIVIFFLLVVIMVITVFVISMGYGRNRY